MIKIPRPVQITLISSLLFVFFFYLSFPYVVLKELVSSEILNRTGFSVRMEDLSPSFPLGIKATSLKLTPPGSSKSFEIAKAYVNISILSFLIGNLGIDIELDSIPKGQIDLSMQFSLFSLISGSQQLPHKINMVARDFKIDDVSHFALNTVASGEAVNPLIQPVLKGMGFNAKLDGTIKLNLDYQSPSQSSGVVDITLKDALLKLSDPSLGLPDQKFTIAKIKMNAENGVLKIDDSSKFVAEEISVEFKGKVNLKKPISGSELDLNIPLKISGGLREKFGFLVDAVAGGVPHNGELKVMLKGPLATYSTSF